MRAISFASEKYYPAQNKWIASCKKAGLTDIVAFREGDLQQIGLVKGKRGFGFWCWKAPLIIRSLMGADAVLYMDVDYELRDVGPLDRALDVSPDGLVLFEYPFEQKIWTRRDCFYYMDCDTPHYWNARHLEAGVSLWRKTEKSAQVLEEWMNFCQDRRIISDDPNTCGLHNHPEFKDHRHDQSVLTNLKTKYALPTLPITFLRGLVGGVEGKIASIPEGYL